MVRRRRGRKRALGTRAPMVLPNRINQRWSLDFVSDTLSDGRRFRILCIVDDFSRECLAAVIDTSLGGVRVARELERLTIERAIPEIVVSDNELSKKATAGKEHTSAVARGASNSSYDCAIEKTMHRRGSLRVGATAQRKKLEQSKSNLQKHADLHEVSFGKGDRFCVKNGSGCQIQG